MATRFAVPFAVLLVGGVAIAALHDEASVVAGLAIATVLALVLAFARRRRFAEPEVSAALAELEARIEEAARQRDDMRARAQTAGRFREEFVGAVRHELKTPLNAILGFTQVLLEEIDGPITEQQREDVSAIRQAGIYLSDLVQSVLVEWAPDDRDTPEPLLPVDLPALIREVARLLEGQAHGKGVAIRVEIDPDVPKPLGDARRLRQVLINLGTNAVRATARGTVTLAAGPDPDGARLTVRDTGRGLAKDALPTIFEEFRQSGTGTERLGGSGLGLALTRDLVDWHGGQIVVESEPGTGSTFHVILPLEPE